jgi:hypothetical protein
MRRRDSNFALLSREIQGTLYIRPGMSAHAEADTNSTKLVVRYFVPFHI